MPDTHKTSDTATMDPPPSQITTLNPEILPNATSADSKVETPKISVQDASQSYTLEDEQEGDILSGAKEIWAEGNTEAESKLQEAQIASDPQRYRGMRDPQL
jgi:hypothetical protein